MKRMIFISKKYLLFPIRVGETIKKLNLHESDKTIFEFYLPVGSVSGNYAFQYYGALPMDKWKNKQVVIEGDVPNCFFDAIAVSDSIPDIIEPHPMIHFTPKCGWMNDPNGLFYQNGTYHLFFQHNPFDINWGNISWGHAVSIDLLHWEQLDDALFPDEDGLMFSGSAIVNEQGQLGLGKEAAILFYTCAGIYGDKKFVQKIAYRDDSGEKFIKKKGCIVPHIEEMNRDPKVYWDEQRSRYYMVLYLSGNTYAILVSDDLENWKLTQRLTLPYACECPDLRQIPVESGGTKWMFWSADGHYYVGEFDGSVFKPDGDMSEAYQSPLPYAAQTYWGTERVITIPWLRVNNQGKLYTGVMGIPRQLTLIEKNGDYCLRQKVVDEIEKYKVKVLEQDILHSDQECVYCQDKEAAVEIQIVAEKIYDLIIDIYGTTCMYESDSGMLKIAGTAADSESVKSAIGERKQRTINNNGIEYRFMETGGNLRKISFLSDGEILEITVEDGLIVGIYETLTDAKSGKISVNSMGKSKVEIFQIM